MAATSLLQVTIAFLLSKVSILGPNHLAVRVSRCPIIILVVVQDIPLLIFICLTISCILFLYFKPTIYIILGTVVVISFLLSDPLLLF
jgi:hypothetical protein